MSDGHSSIAFSRKRPFRSHASSETSVVSVRPLRSSRRSSTSASSSSIGPAEVFSPFDPSFVEPRIHVPRGRSCASEDIASTLDEVAHRNGFEMLTWEKDRVRIAKEFANTCKLAKDIPHELQDRINALHLTARRADNVQVKLFEAAISENTADDEPFAPQIYVINDVDDELTPPYEFHYSNLMWHGKGVPRPDTENLKGCNCHGPCDPNSRTCSCVKRQQQLVVDSGISGFIYDNKGRLRHHDYPIFECNDMCGCSDDCKNRVSLQLYSISPLLMHIVRWFNMAGSMPLTFRRQPKKAGVCIQSILLYTTHPRDISRCFRRLKEDTCEHFYWYICRRIHHRC